MDLFKILALVSPLLSALIAGSISYFFGVRTKKFELIYQFKMPAFKIMHTVLIEFKIFCTGRAAFFQGNEFSPFYEEGSGALHFRTKISEALYQNAVYFSPESISQITELINDISVLCNIELMLLGGDSFDGLENTYDKYSDKIDDCIRNLYKDLNL